MHDVNGSGTVPKTRVESCLADPRVRRQSQPSQLARTSDEGRALLDDRHSRQVPDNDLEGVRSGHPCELPVALSARSRVKRETMPLEQYRVLADRGVADIPVSRRPIHPPTKEPRCSKDVFWRFSHLTRYPARSAACSTASTRGG